MRALRICLVGVAMAACYDPAIESCRYACFGAAQECPSGLTCAEGMCAAPGLARCIAGDGGATDGGSDGPAIPCGWQPSNVNPCALGVDDATADLVFTGGLLIDTGALTITPASAAGGRFEVHTQIGGQGPEVAVLIARSVAIRGQVHVVGPRPLVILARNDVVFQEHTDAIPVGIHVAPVLVPWAACGGNGGSGTDVPMTTSGFGGGGGGGGFGKPIAIPTSGAEGGLGNVSGGFPGGVGGAAVGNDLLRPLRPGCPGGRGGHTPDRFGAGGGAGGGAIQISARGRIDLFGRIVASGNGGVSADATGPGAGGGGAGGAILLEASMGIIYSGSGGRLCANGGGGGAGNGVTGTTGSDGLCEPFPAPGANQGQPSGGGNGAYIQGDATSGGTGTLNGAGGGGGGPGRIRINGDLTGTPTIIITPRNTTGPPPPAT